MKSYSIIGHNCCPRFARFSYGVCVIKDKETDKVYNSLTKFEANLSYENDLEILEKEQTIQSDKFPVGQLLSCRPKLLTNIHSDVYVDPTYYSLVSFVQEDNNDIEYHYVTPLDFVVWKHKQIAIIIDMCLHHLKQPKNQLEVIKHGLDLEPRHPILNAIYAFANRSDSKIFRIRRANVIEKSSFDEFYKLLCENVDCKDIL